MTTFFLFSIWSFVLFLPVFFVACFFSFFLPGYFLLKKFFYNEPLQLSLASLVLGIIIWGIQGYVFGYLHTRFLTYVYVLVFSIFAFFQREAIKEFLLNVWNEVRGCEKKIFLIILLGIIVEMIPIFVSGLLFQEGVRFFSINGTDGIMHLAYIQSITHNFPPQEPGAHGDLITNYHYWSDLVISDIARIWLIPIPHLYFRFFPLLISLLTGFLAYVVIIKLGGGKIAATWGAFLMYFSGDAPFVFSILHKSFGFMTPAIDNGALQFINMPHAMSRMLFLGGLLIFIQWLASQKKQLLVYSVLTFAALIGFKIYFGLFTAVGLCLVFLGRVTVGFAKTKHIVTAIKREGFLLLFLIIFVVIEAVIFLPPNKGAGGLYFSALDWPKLLLGAGGVNLTQWWKLYRLSIAHNQQIFVVLLDIIAIVFSLVIIYGTRVVGFLPSKKNKKLPLELQLFLIPGIIVFNLLGLFTLQVSGGLNVFNFFAVSTVPLTIFAAFTLEEWVMYKKHVGMVLVVVFVLLTVPRSLYEDGMSFYRYITHVDSYFVSQDELAGLMFLRTHGINGALVQSHPMNHWDMRAPYVAFFTDRDSYLSGVGIQETHNQPINARKVRLLYIFNAPNSDDFRAKLIQNGITYVYWRKNNEEVFPYKPTEGHFYYLFENNGVTILSPKH